MQSTVLAVVNPSVRHTLALCDSSYDHGVFTDALLFSAVAELLVLFVEKYSAAENLFRVLPFDWYEASSTVSEILQVFVLLSPE